MNKEAKKEIISLLPDALKTAGGWVKNHFENNAKDLVENTGGTIGLVIKIFGKPLLQKYFENQSNERLSNYGIDTYIRAAYRQAAASIEFIQSDVLLNELTHQQILELFDDVIASRFINIDQGELVMIFQPKYHPVIIEIKSNYFIMLERLGVNVNTISKFKKHFNDHIEAVIQKEFGGDYDLHLSSLSDILLKNNEADLLWDTVQLGRIGFEDSENLKYETTYGEWKIVQKLKDTDHESENLEIIDDPVFAEGLIEENPEEKLRPVIDLIEQYFKGSPQNHLDKILFIVADFGKGKSVFLKRYASMLAKKILETGEGYFPVYFNLRNFNNYSSDINLGVISDFLQTKYGIDISSEYFRTKRYCFLVDSLDESGELDKQSIEEVISSVKRIQNIDKTKYRTNRIVITTRPFDEGLEYQLNNHHPFTTKNSQGREVNNFAAIYGFKQDQFNSWLNSTLKGKTLKTDGAELSKKVFKKIKAGQSFDFYSELLSKNTLSKSELRRPIFAYMIYQLIINNVDFLKVGKIGVYLSFLNLLSKEAKHINDPAYEVNLREEFEFRNILHSTAALWMYERHQGKQGSLNKADICRVLDGENKNETDSQILERYRNQRVVEIEFLSHSYFGQNDNTLHFQHQSFAEILLAEYYLKVFIKFSLDEEFEVDKARAKLILGFPTSQTMAFFIELLELLKDTTSEVITEEILEKRKLLFPLFASLATRKNNYLFCNNIYYEWFKKCDLEENTSKYPEKSIKNWYFNAEKLNKVIQFSKEIINSNSNYYLVKAENKSSLYNKEIILLQNSSLNKLPLDVDKWLALLVGNMLYNDLIVEDKPQLYNWDLKISHKNLFEMILNYNHSNGGVIPHWGRDLFQGINMKGNDVTMRLYTILNHINFSYSFFRNIDLSGCLLGRTKFDYCSFVDVTLSRTYMWGTSLKSIQKVIGTTDAQHINISDTVINLDLFHVDIEVGDKFKFVSRKDDRDSDFESIFIDFLSFNIVKSNVTTDSLKSFLKFSSKLYGENFFLKLDSAIKNYLEVNLA